MLAIEKSSLSPSKHTEFQEVTEASQSFHENISTTTATTFSLQTKPVTYNPPSTPSMEKTLTVWQKIKVGLHALKGFIAGHTAAAIVLGLMIGIPLLLGLPITGPLFPVLLLVYITVELFLGLGPACELASECADEAVREYTEHS